MSKKNVRDRNQRKKLYEAQNGICYWCPTKMVYYDIVPFKTPEDAATLDHVYDKFHPLRNDPTTYNHKRHVLACSKCNHSRGKENQAAQPIEELRRRSKHGDSNV